MSEIRNIVFDLGGVLLNINPDLSVSKLAEITHKKIGDFLPALAKSRVTDYFDMGKINENRFRNEVRKLVCHTLTDAQIDEAWNDILLDFPQQRIKTLKEVAENYRVFLLSNTNNIHYPKYTTDFKQKFGETFSDMFEKMYLSFELKMHKPDKAIFDHIIKDKNLNPAETLLIDDTLKNVEGAIQAGWKAVQVTPEKDITALFENGILKTI